jgi:hypothetical protein
MPKRKYRTANLSHAEVALRIPRAKKSASRRALGGYRFKAVGRPKGKRQMRSVRLGSLRGLEHHFRAGGLTPAPDVVEYARKQRRKISAGKTTGRVRHWYPRGM